MATCLVSVGSTSDTSAIDTSLATRVVPSRFFGTFCTTTGVISIVVPSTAAESRQGMICLPKAARGSGHATALRDGHESLLQPCASTPVPTTRPAPRHTHRDKVARPQVVCFLTGVRFSHARGRSDQDAPPSVGCSVVCMCGFGELEGRHYCGALPCKHNRSYDTCM